MHAKIWISHMVSISHLILTDKHMECGLNLHLHVHVHWVLYQKLHGLWMREAYFCLLIRFVYDLYNFNYLLIVCSYALFMGPNMVFWKMWKLWLNLKKMRPQYLSNWWRNEGAEDLIPSWWLKKHFNVQFGLLDYFVISIFVISFLLEVVNIYHLFVLVFRLI